MPPKKRTAQARQAATVSADASKKRAAERTEREQFGRKLKRAGGELIPKDSVRAILHTFHILTGRKDQHHAGEELSEGAAITKTSNLLGYDADTVREAVASFRASQCTKIPVKDGAARGHRGERKERSAPEQKDNSAGGSTASGSIS